MNSSLGRVQVPQGIFKWRFLFLMFLTVLSPLGCSSREIVATKADVKNAVDSATPLMPNLSVTPQSIPIIDRDSQDKLVTYLVEAKLVNEYWFNVTDYRLDWAGDRTKINLDQLALDIDRAYETNKPFSEELTGSITFDVSAGPFASGSGTVSGPLRAILELFGLIRGVTKLNVERVEIAIKGYADGERSNNWPRVIKHLPDQYRRFRVLDPTDEQNDNWIFYHKQERDLEVHDPYNNNDLPNLRAQYVRNEFVEPFVQRCDNKDRCHIYVLHNKPVRDLEKPLWRKAQVYLMVYLKPQPESED